MLLHDVQVLGFSCVSHREQPKAGSTMVAQLAQRRPSNTASVGSGPRATLHRVYAAGFLSVAEERDGCTKLRLILSCVHRGSLTSQCRVGSQCWIAFVGRLCLSLVMLGVTLDGRVIHRSLRSHRETLLHTAIWICCRLGQRCSDLGALCESTWDMCRQASY